MARGPKKPKDVDTLRHKAAKRLNIPTAEFQSVMAEAEKSPVRIAYERRNRDLDPQLVWRGKDEQDWSDLVVQAPPLYIQEKLHPKVLVDDLLRESRLRRDGGAPDTPDLFADFNGLPDREATAEFYGHYGNWSNRMILGDGLQVMASLAEREGLRGKVQCIYLDPPYGIKFNSNFQWSTTSRDVKDGNRDHITREPEQVKAFRDTWRDGIHSYLTYLRDRLTVARDLLADSGSIFVQIGDENVHRVRALMDEVFGEDNFCSLIGYKKTTGAGSPAIGTDVIASVKDYLIWFAKDKDKVKYRQPYFEKEAGAVGAASYNRVQSPDGMEVRPIRASEDFETDYQDNGWHLVASDNLTSQTGVESTQVPVPFVGRIFRPSKGGWKTNASGLERLKRASRLAVGGIALRYVRRFSDFSVAPINNDWVDTSTGSFTEAKIYVVQSGTKAVQRCLLMTTDPGDLVLDPTCGSGTTAYVAEQWGRRWATVDTSRVALALARARIMGARYPWYLLADSPQGLRKEGEIAGRPPSEAPTHGDIRHGFVYQRVPHITLKSIANNAEIDVIWETWQETLEPLRRDLNAALGRTAEPSLRGGEADAAIQDDVATAGSRRSARDDAKTPWEEWQIPRDAGEPWPATATKAWQQARVADDPRQRAKALDRLNTELGRAYTLDTLPEAPRDPWPEEPTRLHGEWWDARIARQKEIDASIAAKADSEYLYDKPYVDNGRIRVAGPFTVESVSPHRVLAVDQDDELIDTVAAAEGDRAGAAHDEADFAAMILENLKTAGVQQPHKEDRIAFTALTGWPGKYICAEGRYVEGSQEARSAEGGTGNPDDSAGSADGAAGNPDDLAAKGEGAAETVHERRAGILIGPEFGTVSRPDLVAAAREAADAGFDVLIACAFNFDAHSAEFDRLGRIPVLKARMNADLHMADELKNTGKGNLFVVFGEPDIKIEDAADGQIQVRIRGVDVFHPQTGEITSSGPDGIACWFIDTDYNEESFFVRHAYFLGASDPYKALKTTLKAEIDQEAWESLHSDLSRPFEKPSTGRIAVKVINHLGDEVMKVFSVP